MINCEPWADSIRKFADWLAHSDLTAAKKWSKRLRSSDDSQAEGAIGEAVAWSYLSSRCDRIELGDIPGVGGPDFICHFGESRFAVEVQVMLRAVASEKSGLPDTDLHRGWYSKLTKQIRDRVRTKHDQAATVNIPVLVFVITLHWNASHACFRRDDVESVMSSSPQISWKWSPETGESVGDPYQSVRLKDSAFLSPKRTEGDSIVGVCPSISGFLLGGFGVEAQSVRVYGGLNPVAEYPFDPACLSDIPFCSFARWPVNETIQLEWTITAEQEDRAELAAVRKRLIENGAGRFLEELDHMAAHESSTPGATAS